MKDHQRRAPLSEAMKAYAGSGALAFHTPGHKQGLGAHPLLKRLITPEGLREALDALCRRYRSAGALAADPIRIPQGFPDPADREAAAWLAAHLAYGRVGPMLRAIAAALAPLGPRPAAWLRARKPEAIRSELEAALGGWT